MNKVTFVFATLALLFVASHSAHARMSERKATQQITPFYEFLSGKATAEEVKEKFASNWKSYYSDEGYKNLEDTLTNIAGFRKAVPNLNWEIKDVMVSGNTVIVRGEATGTPAGDTFLGSPVEKGKSFKIMSIDIHTFSRGKVSTSYHIEDWAGALQQIAQK